MQLFRPQFFQCIFRFLISRAETNLNSSLNNKILGFNLVDCGGDEETGPTGGRLVSRGRQIGALNAAAALSAAVDANGALPALRRLGLCRRLDRERRLPDSKRPLRWCRLFSERHIFTS